MIKNSQIEQLAEAIARKFKPERIILFGSYAQGNPDPDSDVDLLVVMNTRKHTLDAAVSIRQAVSHDFPIDIIVRTPRQIQKRLAAGDSFLQKVIGKGKILYETRS